MEEGSSLSDYEWEDPWDKNPYYSPEKVGLKIIDVADAGHPYSFDMFVVWERESGGYTWGADSGCSCPSPFESFKVDEMPVGSVRDALTDLKAWVGVEPKRFYDWEADPDPEHDVTWEYQEWRLRTTAASSLREKLEALHG